MARPIAHWLLDLFPQITPAARPDGGWGGDPCWIAQTMTRDAEHNPPLYWLGRAFDAVATGGATETVRARLHSAHGETSCGGDLARDAAVQDVLTEVCAYAWVQTHLGPPCFEVAGEEHTDELAPVTLRVPSIGASVAAHRLRPQRSMADVIEAIRVATAETDDRLPAGSGRIVYLDTWHDPRYAQSIGYRLELTEPVQQALRHLAGERGLGHVLTRPFQWGNAIDAWY